MTRSKSALFVESVQAHGKRCKSPEKHRFLKNRRINDKHLVFATFVSQSDAIATRCIHPGQQAKEQNINTDFSKTRCVHPIFPKCAFPDCCRVFCMLQRARHTVSNLCISQILRPETVGKVCPRAGRFGTSGGRSSVGAEDPPQPRARDRARGEGSHKFLRLSWPGKHLLGRSEKHQHLPFFAIV